MAKKTEAIKIDWAKLQALALKIPAILVFVEQIIALFGDNPTPPLMKAACDCTCEEQSLKTLQACIQATVAAADCHCSCCDAE